MEENNQSELKSASPNRKYRNLRRFGRVILGILIFFALIVIFIRSPWGQSLIKDRLVSYISNKTNTEVAIEKLFITFDGDVQLDGLYLEDKKGDTLIYSKSLEANIALWDIIKGNGFGVDALDWSGVRANIIQKDTISGFNFEFLLKALPGSSSQTATAVDTSAAPMKITLKNLSLEDFNVVYKDDVAGIDSHFIFDELKADMENVDPETMTFTASNLTLKNSKIKLIQKPVPTSNEESSPLPNLAAETLRLNNVVINYESFADRIRLDANITELYSEIPKLNLANNRIEINELQLKNSVVKLFTETENNVVTEKAQEVAEEIEQDIKTFEWPDLRFAISNITLANNSLGYYVGNAQVTNNKFNPKAVELNQLNLDGESFFINDKSAGMTIDDMNFKEASGYNLKDFKIQASITDKKLDINNIRLYLGQNLIQGDMKMEYPKLSALFEAPEMSKIKLDFSNFNLDLTTLFALQPELKENPYMVTLSKKNIKGNIKASGFLSDIQLSKLNISWGKTTQVSANGSIQNITKPDIMTFNIPNFNAETKRQDIIKFIDEQDLSVSLPEDVKLIGSINGSLSGITTNAKVTTTQGIALIDGYFRNSDNLAFDAIITIEDYELSKLLNDPRLGTLSATIETSGKGSSINSLDANVDATISSFQFNDYQIEDLKIKGSVQDGEGIFSSKYQDDNLNMTADASVFLDSIAPEATLELDIIGADLQGLGVSKRNIRTGLTLYADFKGNFTNYDLAAIVDDGVIVYDDKTYLLGDINTLAHVRKDTTSFSIQNKLVEILLQSNTDPLTFGKSLQRHVGSYFYRDTEVPDTLTNPVNLKLRGYVAQAPVLNEVFLVNVKDLDTIDIAVDFNEKERKLKANITAPHINYNDYEVDSLAFSMYTDKEKFNFDFGFKEINAGPILLPRSLIKGEQLNNELSLDFLAYHDDDELMNVKAEITGNRERLRFHVKPNNLILNKNPWITPEDNEIIITDKNLAFNNFRIDRNEQSIEITDKKPATPRDHIAINYNNFKISEVFNYLNPTKQLATGTLNGDFILREPFGDTGILADLAISSLEFMDVNMGTLSLNGESLGNNGYNIIASTKGGEIDMELDGNYIADVDGAKLDLNLDIIEFQMSALNGFSQGEITETDGSFNGNFKLSGTTVDTKYQGNLNFNDADFKIAMFNSSFTLPDENLSINNEGLTMSNFTILDANKNAFVMSGSIGTETLLNPTFDLNINAENFQVLDATEEDNDFLYGTATFDANAKITGDLQIPKIDITATVNSNTDVTYVMPSATVNIEEREGIVVFVNRENPDAILTRTEEQTAKIKGFDINARLNVGKDAAVTIVIDQETGDNFKVFGEGDFNFNMNPNGRMNLVGVYDVSGGHYEMSLYNLVNRRFEIAPESRVSWSGDPFDAKLDVRAIYNVETSASGLMAPASSSIGATDKGRYRQVLPFYVYLNIEGELMAPRISFNLDMPEDEQGAIGGQVFGRVQQINQQEDELNRQVFSLLVLNRFYPDPGSDGSQGGVASIARDNLNDALSDQLNVFSEKLFGKSGFEFDFGLDSYTDYQGSTPQDRTQLDIAAQKKLFDDRLIVRVGSEVDIQGSSPTNESTPFIGNVSLEYLLTENGRYRLKGFRRNEFENVIDGQTIVTGIALIFTQEFNKFDELWDAMFKSQTKEEKIEEEKLKKAEEEHERKEKETTKSMEEKKNN